MKLTLYIGLLLLFILHNDLWLWDNATIIWGVPVGLLYHIIYCFITTAFMALLVKYAWPTHLEKENGKLTE